MQKKSKKQDIELMALLFLLGLLLFLYPVVTQVSSYQADEEAYEDLAMESSIILIFWNATTCQKRKISNGKRTKNDKQSPCVRRCSQQHNWHRGFSFLNFRRSQKVE